MKFIKIVFEIIFFTIRRYWIPIFSIIVFGIVLYTTFDSKIHLNGKNSFWDRVVDPSFTVAGLSIPFLIWLYFLGKEWRESLDNKLIVHFTRQIGDKKNYLMSCYNVNLLDNGDMRAIGQQIGLQMSGSHLKFNPSLKPLKEEVIQIRDEFGRRKWIKYFEIEFLLDGEPNEVFQTENKYVVWNLFNEKRLPKKIKRLEKPFDEFYKDNISITELLSFDKKSREKFEAIANTELDSLNKIYILNSPIITSFGMYEYYIVNHELIKTALNNEANNPQIVSAIGHKPTAKFLSKKLDCEIPFNRIEIKMVKGDMAIVFKVKTRLEENTVLSEEELEAVEIEYGILKRLE